MHRAILSGVILLLILQATSGFDIGKTELALGYNVTVTNVAPEGRSTIIIDGVVLADSFATGFFVKIGTDNCRIRFEIWQKLSDTQFKLERFQLFQASRGYYEVTLSPGNQFRTNSNQRLGFSSLNTDSTCVGYEYVTDRRRSQTRRHFFKNTNSPSIGQTYKFDPYQTTFLFPIGIIVKNPSFTTEATTLPTTTIATTTTTTTTQAPTTPYVTVQYTRFIGYNYTTSQMAQPGQRSIIHHGLQLRDGKVVGFRFRNAKLGCRPRLQLWRLVSETIGQYNYTLIFEKIYDGSNTGLIYMPLDKSEYFDIIQSDKLGFTTEDVNVSCIPFHYVQTNLRSQTINRFFPRDYPRLFQTISLLPYQTTLLFALEVELIATGQMGATGPQGRKGERGEAGQQGNRGPTGYKGQIGNMGQMGDRGDMGSIGNKGPSGDVGSRGDVGDSGRVGFTGQGGISGTKGDQGIKGQRGDNGFGGARGDYGERGFPGHTGATGSIGDKLQGEDGATGEVGPIGSTGIKGVGGDPGRAGPDGLSGPIGQVGVTGPRGQMWSPDNINYCGLNPLNCAHHCVNTRLGAKCECRTGYELTDETKCIEINECRIENARCEYDCINTPGSYYCACPPGLRLSKDKLRCNDFDECAGNTAECKTNQICINLWNDHYCAGPFTQTPATPVSSSLIGTDVKLVTREVIIGLLLWLILLSILTIMAAIMMIPECRDCCGSHPSRGHPPGRRPQFYYPAFFPRVSLDRRPSSDRVDIIDARQSRNEHLERNENDGIVNEAHIHDGQQRSEL